MIPWLRPGIFGGVVAVALTACAPPVNNTPTDNPRIIAPDGSPTAPVAAPSSVTPQATVRFGVLTIDSALSVSERYGPLLAYLSTATGRPFELVPLTQASQFTAVATQDLDFTTTNPLAAEQVRRLYGTRFLVTHSRPGNGAEFGGLIIVHQDSSLHTLANLRGQRVACVNKQTAAAGCVFQIKHLLDQGIDPERDFGEFLENGSQDNIVLAVLNGTLDAGFIRTGQLEKMAARGLLEHPDRLRVLDPQPTTFPYPHTTALYPEWPIAALAHTDPALATAVTEALLALPPNHPALTAANLDGFVPAADYALLTGLIETLQLRSWDAVPGP